MNPPTKRTLPAFEDHWALFLDIDGTLVDFVDQPDQVKVDDNVVRILRELHRLTRGAVVLVSGRTIESVDAVVEPLRLPTAGLHGYERRDTRGRVHRETMDVRGLDGVREHFRSLTERYPGSFVEEKGPTMAFHYRRVETTTIDEEALACELEPLVPEPFCLQRGKRVLEVRSRDYSKGSAIESFMKEPALEDRTAVFMGDDATDEHGFTWVNEHGGVSIKVGPGDSAARFRIRSVAAAVSWLDDYVRALDERERG